MTRLFTPCLALCLLALPLTGKAQIPNDWMFLTLPADGTIMGSPSSEIGWGYQITNSSPTYWLYAYGLEASDELQYASGNLSPFDYPLLPPETTLVVPYDGTQGLAHMTWDATAPIGFVNQGEFIVSAAWFDGDYFSGGQLVGDLDEKRVPYRAIVTQNNAVPEGTSSLPLAVLTVMGLWRLRYRRRSRE